MLGGLALKWRWRERDEAAGKPTDRPNLVMGINVQVVWEKFCRYWDVEPRYVPLGARRLTLTAEEAVEARAMRTRSASWRSSAPRSTVLRAGRGDRRRARPAAATQGPDIPVHVDGASGGFVAPFIDPDLSGTSGCQRVQSINASGHKYGLVYPGVGWVDLARRPRTCPRTWCST